MCGRLALANGPHIEVLTESAPGLRTGVNRIRPVLLGLSVRLWRALRLFWVGEVAILGRLAHFFCEGFEANAVSGNFLATAGNVSCAGMMASFACKALGN